MCVTRTEKAGTDRGSGTVLVTEGDLCEHLFVRVPVLLFHCRSLRFRRQVTVTRDTV